MHRVYLIREKSDYTNYLGICCNVSPILRTHSSEKKVLGQLKNREKCFKICRVYGKRKPM